jgi:glyoxylase-like metal-dependent hydrolase (beta-lactamase superfamily II)
VLSLSHPEPQPASRRRLFCACAALGLLGRTWRPAYAAAPAATEGEEAVTVDMRAVQVAEGAWFVQGQAALGSAANQNFISNAGFVVTPAGVVVIDALGSPPLARRLLKEIACVTSQPVRYVIATHYHADHIYGLQVFQDAGATVIAHAAARDYLASETARLRLAASRQELAPWVDDRTRLVQPDRWLGVDDPHADTTLELGGVRLLLRPVGPAHTPEDLVVFVPGQQVLYGGDLLFRGRIPFVGQADSRAWIAALDKLLALQPRVLVPGHGAASTEPLADIALTRDYLSYLRERMGAAARDLEPFDEAYARTDWSRFAGMPLFQAANRMNAYNTYLLMEHEKP